MMSFIRKKFDLILSDLLLRPSPANSKFIALDKGSVWESRTLLQGELATELPDRSLLEASASVVERFLFSSAHLLFVKPGIHRSDKDRLCPRIDCSRLVPKCCTLLCPRLYICSELPHLQCLVLTSQLNPAATSAFSVPFRTWI